MILGDSLQVMASLAEREKLRGKVQMIYIDPPYGIKFGSNWQVSARSETSRTESSRTLPARQSRSRPSATHGSWASTPTCYLRDRLVAARDLLAESGSASSRLATRTFIWFALMDEVFGSENFVSTDHVREAPSQSSQHSRSTARHCSCMRKDCESVKYRRFCRAAAAGERGAES